MDIERGRCVMGDRITKLESAAQSFEGWFLAREGRGVYELL